MNFSENEIIWTLVRSHREECYGLNHMAKQVMNLFSIQLLYSKFFLMHENKFSFVSNVLNLQNNDLLQDPVLY